MAWFLFYFSLLSRLFATMKKRSRSEPSWRDSSGGDETKRTDAFPAESKEDGGPTIQLPRITLEQQQRVDETEALLVASTTWKPHWKALLDVHKQKYKDEREHLVFHSKHHHWNKDQRENEQRAGAARRKQMELALDNMGIERAKHQKKFHDMVLDAAAPHVYGLNEYTSHLPEIYKRTGFMKLMQQILSQMPRRFGKTTMVAMIVAVLIAFVHGMTVAIFSTSEKTSHKLLVLIKTFVFMIKGAKERKDTDNAAEFSLTDVPVHKIKGARRSDGSTAATSWSNPLLTSIVYSYSCSTLARGFTVKMIILEEAAHIPDMIWKEVVAPALGVAHMVLLAITTPQDPDNYFSKLLDVRLPSGEPVFQVQAIIMACKKCIKQGIASKCDHVNHRMPKWKTAARQEMVRAIYGDKDKDMFLQEAGGMIVSQGKQLFAMTSIKQFMSAKSHSFQHHPNVVYTFVDPHGGGLQSSQAIVSITFDRGICVVPPPPRSASRLLLCFFITMEHNNE